MTNDVHIIETDDYLDLSDFNLCVQEFEDNLSEITHSATIGQFSPDTSVEDPKDSKTITLRVLKNKNDWKDWSLIDKEERWTDGLLYELFPNTKEFILIEHF